MTHFLPPVMSEDNGRIYCGHQVATHQWNAETISATWPVNSHFAATDSNGQVIIECYLNNNHVTNQSVYFDKTHKYENKSLDKGYLCYSNHWCANYQHFLMETFPKIFTYKTELLNTCPILIPEILQNKLVADTLDLLGIPDSHIIHLNKDNTIYHVNTLYYSSYVSQPSGRGAHCGPFVSLKALQELSLEKYPAGGHENIYISRTDKRSRSYNNSQTSSRILANENEVVERLRGHGFHPVFLGSTSIDKKVELLRDAQTIIVPSGASIMNIIFVKSLKKLIVLESGQAESMMLLFEELCSYLHPEAQFIRVPAASLGETLNLPFTANPDLIIEQLN